MNLEVLYIESQLSNSTGIISPTVIWDENDCMLVDAGLPGSYESIKNEFVRIGVRIENLNKIIITHSDIDHIGGLAGIISNLPQKLEIISHSVEKPYIQAEVPPVKLSKMEESIKLLEGETYERMKVLANSLRQNYPKLKADVDMVVDDGEELPFLGGIEIIHMPGHTKGHICLYLKNTKTLIAGDVLFVKENKIINEAVFNFDNELALKSMEKLLGYDIEKIICYHGGIFTGNVEDGIKKILGK